MTGSGARPMPSLTAAAILSAALCASVLLPSQAAAETPPPPVATQPVAAPPVNQANPAQGEAGWQPGIDIKKSQPGAAPRPARPARPSNTTVIERAGDGTGNGQIRLVALLTVDGQQIDQGLVWRIYQHQGSAGLKSKLLAENRDASPALKLQPGDYTVNASFGRAHLTRKITVKPGASGTERFVLNAGGLRLTTSVGGKPVTEGSITYAIYSDDRDQVASRSSIMTGAKPGLVIRLNAGIYHLVSTYGDANAKVEVDVTVEAGKLTEAAVAHQAAKAAFKLVTRAGGEALTDTHWTITSQSGEIIKESVGALPAHVLAPGSYTVLAKSGGRAFKRSFALKDGEMINVEVLAEGGEAPPAALDDAVPALDLKNP